jgi:hypothetical protein
MVDQIAYVAEADKTLAAAAQDTLQYTPGPTETFYIVEWRMIGAVTFDVIDIRNSEQFKYTQCSVTHPIPSTMIQSPLNAFLAFREWKPPLKIKPSMTFSVDVKDTGGGGKVTMLLIGYKEIGASA